MISINILFEPWIVFKNPRITNKNYNKNINIIKITFILFNIILNHNLVSCQLLLDNISNNNIRRQDIIKGDTGLGNLFVGEVSSEGEITGTGNGEVIGNTNIPVTDNINIDENNNFNNHNNEKLPYDIITFTKKNNLQNIYSNQNKQINNYKIIGAKFERNNYKPKNDYTEVIFRNNNNFNNGNEQNFHEMVGFQNVNENKNKKEILGTNNLIKYVNDHIEQDALRLSENGINDNSITPKTTTNNNNYNNNPQIISTNKYYNEIPATNKPVITNIYNPAPTNIIPYYSNFNVNNPIQSTTFQNYHLNQDHVLTPTINPSIKSYQNNYNNIPNVIKPNNINDHRSDLNYNPKNLFSHPGGENFEQTDKNKNLKLWYPFYDLKNNNHKNVFYAQPFVADNVDKNNYEEFSSSPNSNHLVNNKFHDLEDNHKVNSNDNIDVTKEKVIYYPQEVYNDREIATSDNSDHTEQKEYNNEGLEEEEEEEEEKDDGGGEVTEVNVENYEGANPEEDNNNGHRTDPWVTPNRAERLEGDDDYEPFKAPPKDLDEERVRHFVSEHEKPREIPTRLKYRGGGLWSRPSADSGIQLDFIPQQIYSQTRRSSTVKFLPQEEAIAAASTPEEVVNAPRLREVISHKKTQEVYEEEGYEDTAYDHGGYKKAGKHEEETAKNTKALIPEDEIVDVPDPLDALKEHEKYIPKPSDDHETQGSRQKQVVQRTTPYGTPKVRTWKSEKTISNEKSLTFLDNNGKSDVHIEKTTPHLQGTVGRSIQYSDGRPKETAKMNLDGLNLKNNLQENAKLNIPDTLTQHSNPSGHSIKFSSENNADHKKKTSNHKNEDYNSDPTKKVNNHYNIDPRNVPSRNSERIKERQNAYIRKNNQHSSPNQKSKPQFSPSSILPDSDPQNDESQDEEEMDPNHPHSFYSGSFVYNKAKMIKLDKSGLPVDKSSVAEDDDEKADEYSDNKSSNKGGYQEEYEEYKDYDELHLHKRLKSNQNKEDTNKNISKNRQINNQHKANRNSNHRSNDNYSQHYQNHKRNRPENYEAVVTPVISTVTESGQPIGILTQWSTPIIAPSSYDDINKYSTLSKRHPVIYEQKVPVQDDSPSQAESTLKIPSLVFPTWNGESSVFESITEKNNQENLNFQTESSLTSRNLNKNYMIIPRQKLQIVRPIDTDTLQTEWKPVLKESNVRHPFLSKDDKKFNIKDNGHSASDKIVIKEKFDKDTAQDKLINNSDVNISPSSSVKHIEQLTLAHYSNPGNLLLYKPESLTKQNRLKNLADELNRSVESKNDAGQRQDATSVLKRKKRYTENENVEQESKVEQDEENEDGEEYLDDEETSLENYQSDENVPKHVELVNIEAEGTTTAIPVDTNKYPFYTRLPTEGLEKFSPLRYAMNPKYIPKKTGEGMEFYESRDHIECEEPSPPKVVPQRNEDGEWNAKPVPDGPRLKGLGDKIKCLRMKYFGKDPLDNPFFKEETVSVPKVFEGNRKSDNIEDQLGLYVDIMTNIKANSDPDSIKSDGRRLKIIQTKRPTRNITYNLNDKFKGYGKKFHNGFKPYYGKFNKYSSSYKNIGGQPYVKQKYNRGENKFSLGNNKNTQQDIETSSTSSNALSSKNKQWNNYNNKNSNIKNNEENFDSFIPSYLPIKDDTISTVENVENHYNNACKHYEYLLKPLMSLVPPSPASPQTYIDDRRKKQKSAKPMLYPSSIYSVLNSNDDKKHSSFGKHQRFVRRNTFTARPPLRFTYAIKPNNKFSSIKKNPLLQDNAPSGSVYRTMVTIKELSDPPNQHTGLKPKRIQQFYTVIKRTKRELKEEIKQEIISNYNYLQKHEPHKVAKRMKRNLSIDPLSKPVFDLPSNFNNKYHKIISRDDRIAENSSMTTESNKDDKNSSVDNGSTPRTFKKLTQELTIILNVHDSNGTSDNDDNDRPQRKATFSQTNKNNNNRDANNSNGSTDTIFSSSRKIESTSKTDPVNIYATNSEEIKSAGHVSRLSGGFISRHSPVYSSKYKKGTGITNENDAITTLSGATTSETSTNPVTENQKSNVLEENYPTPDSITTTTTGRLKVRFPKLTAKPTVAIVPEDQIKTIKKSNKNVTRIFTTTTTTSTTEQAPMTTTRMYKPKRVYKKENNRNRVVDVFAVLNRQRDASSERSPTTSTPSSTDIFEETSVTTTILPTTTLEIKELPTRRTRQKNNPRNFHVEHRRITKEEVIKRTYSDDRADDEEGSRELKDHPDLRDPTARVGKENIEDEKDEIGASSSNKDEVINETLMYVVDPKTGFGHWEPEPNLQKLSSTLQPTSRSRYSKNHNHKGNYRHSNRNKSRYIHNAASFNRNTKDRLNNHNDNSRVPDNHYQTLSQTPNPGFINSENDYSSSTVKAHQRDPSHYGRPFRRHKVKIHRNKISSVTPIDSDVYLLDNLMTQVPPYPTTTALPYDEVTGEFNSRRKESSTPKIILDPDKRMYYYLPEK